MPCRGDAQGRARREFDASTGTRPPAGAVLRVRSYGARAREPASRIRADPRVKTFSFRVSETQTIKQMVRSGAD